MDYRGGAYSNFMKAFVFYSNPKNEFELDGITVTDVGYVENKKEVSEKKQANAEFLGYNVNIEEDVDTRDNSKIWVVQICDKLSRVAFVNAKSAMQNKGGYYSSFKKGFIFKKSPIQ